MRRENAVDLDIRGLVSQIRLRILSDHQLEWVFAVLIDRIKPCNRGLLIRLHVKPRQSIGSHNAARSVGVELPQADGGKVRKLGRICLQQIGDDGVGLCVGRTRRPLRYQRRLDVSVDHAGIKDLAEIEKQRRFRRDQRPSRPEVVTCDAGSKQGTHIKEIARIQSAVLVRCGNRGSPIPQQGPRTERLKAQQRRSIFGAEIIIFG